MPFLLISIPKSEKADSGRSEYNTTRRFAVWIYVLKISIYGFTYTWCVLFLVYTRIMYFGTEFQTLTACENFYSGVCTRPFKYRSVNKRVWFCFLFTREIMPVYIFMMHMTPKPLNRTKKRKKKRQFTKDTYPIYIYIYNCV